MPCRLLCRECPFILEEFSLLVELYGTTYREAATLRLSVLRKDFQRSPRSLFFSAFPSAQTLRIAQVQCPLAEVQTEFSLEACWERVEVSYEDRQDSTFLR
jgi:hypothetical protein